MNGDATPKAMMDNTPQASTPAAPKSAQKAAQSWSHTARFLTTAAQLDQLPGAGEGEAPMLHEVAFVGRSNAGKSTAINTLAQQKRLAFASKTPGRTQHINLFALGPKDAPNALWADLPGYGYAAVERAAKLRWQQVMADYLVTRRSLAGVVLLVDSRLGLTDLDLRLIQWIGSRIRSGEVKLLCLLTKADKLSKIEATRSLQATQAALAQALGDEEADDEDEDKVDDNKGDADKDEASNRSDVGVCLFSALNRKGVDDVMQALHGWVLAAQPHATPTLP
jgi:GTP-binding protein